jgi:hypothetical protein
VAWAGPTVPMQRTREATLPRLGPPCWAKRLRRRRDPNRDSRLRWRSMAVCPGRRLQLWSPQTPCQCQPSRRHPGLLPLAETAAGRTIRGPPPQSSQLRSSRAPRRPRDVVASASNSPSSRSGFRGVSGHTSRSPCSYQRGSRVRRPRPGQTPGCGWESAPGRGPARRQGHGVGQPAGGRKAVPRPRPEWYRRVGPRRRPRSRRTVGVGRRWVANPGRHRSPRLRARHPGGG